MKLILNTSNRKFLKSITINVSKMKSMSLIWVPEAIIYLFYALIYALIY